MTIEKIKVFISYKWETDQNLRAALTSYLENIKNVEVIIDVEAIKLSQNIHEVISMKLDEDDCLLVSINSLSSNEVVSELIRAHERSKQIFLMEKREADRINIPSYLYFLADSLRFKYSTIDELRMQLREYFEGKSKMDFQLIPQELSLIKNSIKDLRNLLKFRADLIRRILDEAYKEIKKVKDQEQEYKIDVGIEKNFLVRARSMFENANEVYAISSESVSTFWTDSKNKLLAKDYIAKQPKNTIRLFVFSSIRTASKYRYILQASHNSYGKDGRVFICSLRSYTNFLEKFSNGSSEVVKTYLDQDFGILVYDLNSQKNYIEALLNHSELRFKKIDINLLEKINYKEIISYLNDLKKLEFEDIFEDKNGDKKFYIKRWNPKCLEFEDLFKRDLKRLFPGERSGDAYHLIFFKDYDNSLERKILEVKNNLNYYKRDLGIQFIWVGKKTDRIAVSDFSYGDLRLNFDYDYLLMMRFDSYNDLRIYYSDQRHSDIRKNFYSSFNEGIGILYQYIDELKKTEPNKTVPIFEQVIEEIVSNYMVRYDFVEKEDIDSIIKESPYPFSYKYDYEYE
ncbi:hypothetical protein [Nostoc sp. LPT]|uniref:hypothetical protein n=1 Tax=Nostoc sp. LPT TaxID=2815387 RepID=UPI001E11A93C|nr:hypothetical protein [Nostoc sp. LPT]MBN4005851.1 toll/interleukin-1 receptor domain-containing protein [Nostoc sp. LPT]